MLTIDGERIYLKEFTLENLHDEKYHVWLRDIDVIQGIYRMEYYLSMKFDSIEAYINSLLESTNDSMFAIYLKENDHFIGTFKVGHIDWRVGIADIGIMIGEKQYWGRGLSKDVLLAGCDYALKHLSLRRLTGGCLSTNFPMVKCFESVGFKREGVLRNQLLVNGEYIDHYLYGILKNEFYQSRGD